MDLKILLGFLFCVTVIVYADQTEDKGSESADSPPTPEDDSDMYMEPLEDHDPSTTSLEAQADTGHWYPSFLRNYDRYEQPPLGHSRPFWYNGYHQQQGAYSQRNDPPQRQDVGYNDAPKYNGLKGYTNKGYVEETAPPPPNDKVGILGDGNFGVIEGGTFYPEKDGYDSSSDSSGLEDFNSFFHNGHGRPSYFYPSNPKAGTHQQFENFRDFADINAPTDRQYSQYVVVYTNKNGTRTSSKESEEESDEAESENEEKKNNVDVKRPNNILESLALLDSADSTTSERDSHTSDQEILTKTLLVPMYDHGDIIEIPPEKKGSKSKRKLTNLVPEKKHEARLLQKAKDLNEPLLALS